MTVPAAAMILAAGRGERMRPLSDAVPKPALPLPSGPVVGSALRQAAACGVVRIAVNAWHLADSLEDAVRAAAPRNAAVAVCREPVLLGGAGGLANARELGLLGTGGPVLAVNGDVLIHLDLEPLLERAARGDDLVTLALIPHLDPARWARVGLDPDGLVTGFHPPGTTGTCELPLLYPGAMVVSREALDGLPAGPGGIMDRLWRPALDSRRLGGVVVPGHWREVGTPEDYLEAALARLDGTAVVDPTARVHRKAAVGAAWIGPGAVVAAGAVVGDGVVTHGARVGRNARVFGSVLLGPVSVDAGETATGVFRAAAIADPTAGGRAG